MTWLRNFWTWNHILELGGTVAVNILFWTFSYFVIAQIQQIGFRSGWLKSNGQFGWIDFAAAIIIGCFSGCFQFSDRQRAKETKELQAAAKDRKMI